MLLGELQRLLVASAVCAHCGFVDDNTRPHLDDPDRVCVSVRVDTNDEVQLICEHPESTSSPGWGTRTGAGLGMEPLAARL
jgi:hypothetical protein